MTKVTFCGSGVFNASATSVVVTLTEAVPAGDTVVFAGFTGFVAMASVSAVDSKGNVWDWVTNQGAFSSSNGPYQVGLLVRVPLAIGDTVTLTFRSAAGGTGTAVAETRGTVIAAHMTGARDVGGAQPDVLDLFAGQALTSTTPAPPAGAAPSPPVVELMALRVTVTTDADPVTAIPSASGWQELGRVRSFSGSSGIQEVLVWRLKTTATPIAATETFTLNASLGWRIHVASWMVDPAGVRKFDAGPNEIQSIDAGPYEYFASPLQTVTATSVPSAEAFGVATMAKKKTLTAVGVPTTEAFTAGIFQQLMIAQGPHPTNDDARTLVTGPEDLSTKRFLNPVTLTGPGLVATGVAFSKQATFLDDVNANFRNAWFDVNDTGYPFRVSCGSGHTASITLRAFQGDTFKGDMPDIDGLGSITVNLYNGRFRPVPFNAATTTTLTGVGIPTSEAIGSSSAARKTALVATGIPTSQVFGVASVVQILGGPVTTPAAYGPSTPISTTLSAAGPSYTVQVLASGALRRSDTLAAITIAQTEYTGGTLVIESDTPGTRRTPAAGVLNRVRMKSGKIILRDLTLTTAMGQMESLNSVADYAIELQGCNGTTAHLRLVGYTVGGWRLTKSPSGLYCGQNSPAAGVWSAFNLTDPENPVPTPALRIDNFTGHPNSAATGPAITIDAGLNVFLGGFDPGSASTPSVLPPQAVRFDASVRVGGTKLDVQDVYIGDALDGTPSLIASKANSYSVWAGVCKRSGIDSATFPNTAGSRPEKPIWWALNNGTTPGGETSGNTTNDRVIAEGFVLRNALAQNDVNATFRDGATRLMEFEVKAEVYDPAVPLTLWTPSDIADQWPNGARRFINVNAAKGALGARPTIAATMPNGLAYQNKSVIDNTWTHMGGVAGDGVTEIVDRVFDPDLMIDGAGTSGKRFQSNIKNGGIQLIIAPNAAQSGGTVVTLSSTPHTLVVKKPDGTAPDFTNWDASGTFGIYTGYFDPSKPNEVETGIPYRRQLKYTGIDTTAGAFLGVTLVPRPTSTPSPLLPAGKIIRVVAGVAETFHPHGMPTGDLTDIAVPGLTLSNAAMTRVDDWRFLINGQTGFTWNASGSGLYGTYTPKTAHAYGLTGTDNSIAMPAGTTLDDTQNINMGQPTSNVNVFVASGAHVRFVRCSFPDISLQASGSSTIIDLVDCDQNITPLPGRYAYDSPAKLGVPGKYDSANQHVQQRMLYTDNALATAAGALFRMDRHVSFGVHGDFCQGNFGPGSTYNQCHIEHGADVGAPTSGGSNSRSGIPGTWPSVNAGVHGDIQQWYKRQSAAWYGTVAATNAHSIDFSRLENNYDFWTGIALDRDTSSGLARLTFTSNHGFNSGDTVRLKNGPAAVTGEWIATKVSNTVLLASVAYTGTASTVDVVATVHLEIPARFRCDFLTSHHADASDVTRTGPVESDGNVSMAIQVTGLNRGHPTPVSITSVIPGDLDYSINVRDSRFQTINGPAGTWLIADPEDTFTRGSFDQNVATQISSTIMQGYMKGSGTANLAFIDTAAQVIADTCKGGHAGHATLSSQFAVNANNPSAGVHDYTSWGGTSLRAWLADLNSNVLGYKSVVNKAIAKGAGTDLLGIWFGCEGWKNGGRADTVIPDLTHMQDHADAAAAWIQAMNAAGRPVTHLSGHQEYKGRTNLPGPPSGWTITGLPLFNASGTNLSLSSVSSYGNFAWETDSSYNPDTWVPNAPGVGPATDANYFEYYAWATTKWLNILWDTIKNHSDPVVNRVKVGRPHIAFGGSLTGTEHTLPLGDLAGTIPPYYWDYFYLVYDMKWSHGADFWSLDYSLIDFNETSARSVATIVGRRNNFGTLLQRVKQLQATYPMSSKADNQRTAPQNLALKRAAPLHMIEYYYDVNLPSCEANYKESEQAMMEGVVLHQLYTNGVEKAHKWQPMSDVSGTTHLNYAAYFRNTNITSTVSSAQADVTQGGASGSRFQAANVAKLFVDHFPVGTPIYDVTTTDSQLVAMLSDTKILVINTNTTTAKTIKISDNAYTLPAKGVAVYDFAPSLNLDNNAWINFGQGGAAVPGGLATPTLT